ncbi:MAG: hypothetical protein UT55_C0051G0006 [Candidatus Peregrinibacteria bacterium GW2011_GWE2_39_6]|nr:MAG: hypothetical protein UT36_C0012G0013 [Candidatus Peregrinibacteria bacterium GW2011_GWF2_39_17]KKR24946.1 MAG: hypothetical protein UT55_C0051G0006 [Candidatus Peregrinibacteria bacterium GW2011_GWE2_39_6]
MSSIQNKLLALLRDQGSVPLKYREIGRRIGEKYPQTVKHHIEILKNKQLIQEKNGLLVLNKKDLTSEDFFNFPFYGIANCGPATAFAEDRIEGFIKISKNAFPKGNVKDFYLIQASGNSMNQAQVGQGKKNIEDGDIVIVNAKNQNPQNGDYVVSIIEGCANIKKFSYNPNDKQVVLISESTDKYFPIVLHENDNLNIAGKIIDVLKISN